MSFYGFNYLKRFVLKLSVGMFSAFCFKTFNRKKKNNINSAKMHLNQNNVVYKFICPFRECLPKDKNNSHIGYTTTTLSRHLTYDLSENSAIKQHLIIKHKNSTNQLTSSDSRKILTDNTIII